jgi:hypothetical protein
MLDKWYSYWVSTRHWKICANRCDGAKSLSGVEDIHTDSRDPHDNSDWLASATWKLHGAPSALPSPPNMVRYWQSGGSRALHMHFRLFQQCCYIRPLTFWQNVIRPRDILSLASIVLQPSHQQNIMNSP